MELNSRNIIETIIQLVYFMRGSVQYDDMMNRTAVERQLMAEFIEKRLDAESEKMYPVY